MLWVVTYFFELCREKTSTDTGETFTLLNVKLIVYLYVN